MNATVFAPELREATPLARPAPRPRPSPLGVALARVGPGWFTSVMGTGILAIGLQLAPLGLRDQGAAALVFFALDLALFAAFGALILVRLLTERGFARATLDDITVAQTWGAPPMAFLTVSVGFLTIGQGPLGAAIAIPIAQALFLAGVALAIFSAGVVPFRMFTAHEIPPHGAIGSWLLPVVPPIVASVPAALLVRTWAPALRPSMLAGAYAMLGGGFALAAIVIVIFYSRLLYAKVPESALVTTTWLVVGPLGQFVAGIVALGGASDAVWPQLNRSLLLAGTAIGLLVWGFGVYWLGMAIALTIRAARKSLPFTLGWWAFTFPVGTLMSASYALYGTTHAGLFELAGLGLLALLAAMWTLVAARSLHHAAAGLHA